MSSDELSIVNIIKNLNEDTNATIKFLEEALISSQKEEYFKLLLLLIKRGVIDNNRFIYIENFLNQIFSNKIHFRYKKFEEGFYKAFIDNNRDLMMINYEILYTSNKLFNAPEDISKYQEILESNELFQEKLRNIYNEVLKYGLKIIETDEEEEKKILNIFSKVRNVTCFYIGEGLNKKLVIRDYPLEQEKISEVKKNAYIAYENRHYHTALKEYKKILCVKKVYSSIYAQIALCYYYLNNIPKAIEYIEAANEIGKNEESKNYDALYEKFIKVDKKNDYKPKCNLDITEFCFNDENFGLGDISNITDFILKTGLDVESACKILLINNEDMNILRLIYAKNFYTVKEFELGDKFIKSVEQSDNKTEKVLKILEEVKSTKKVYSNRNSENLNYSLKLIP